VWKHITIGLALSVIVVAPVLAQTQAPHAHKPGVTQQKQQQQQLPPPPVQQEVRIAAVVNDGVITTSDLENRILLLLRSSGIQDTPENRQRLAARILRSLIDEKIELQEAKHLNVAVPKGDIDAALSRLEKQNNLPPGGLDQYLQNLGIPKASLVDQITAALTWNKLIEMRLAQDVSVSDQEVNDAIKEAKESENTPQNNVVEIFLAVDNPSQDDEVHRLADNLEQQLHAGGNFAAIAQQFSQSPTAAAGGALGWISPGEINPDLEKALDVLKPGEISDPVRAAGGYYILGLVDRRVPGQANPNDAVVTVVEAGAPIPPNAPPDFRQRLAKALDQISHSAGSCASFAAAARKVGLPFVREAPDIKASTLSQGVRHITLDLTVGQVSRPFPVQGGVGLVMLCDRKDAAPQKPPSFEEVRYSIERQHLDILARRYLRDLRRDAYVDIRG
jgi:peptidyl-prolyl cis-trans isomerase SurA